MFEDEDTAETVEKIVGPGNHYVALAKRKVQGWVGVDSDASARTVTWRVGATGEVCRDEARAIVLE